MQSFKAKLLTEYEIVHRCEKTTIIYPYIRDDIGTEHIFCVSPLHGRSFVLRHKRNGKWIIGKGNGLSYTSHSYLLTSLSYGETWGGLTLENAIRDYNIGNQVNKLGIKTNHMEGVINIKKKIYSNGIECQAGLLQYSVECPYRLTDFGFIPKKELHEYLDKWDVKGQEYYLYAAKILIKNLRILHDNHIMHNAMHAQNYTWSLELLDFEASRSNKYPFSNIDYERCVPILIEAEILQTYEIINYVSWCLGETMDYSKVESIFHDYGFVLMSI